MTILSPIEAYALLGLFAGSMILLVLWEEKRSEPTLVGFLVAGRSLSLLRGAFSIAVSWLWAPAIFLCSLQAFTNGVPGIFWFTAPNILCFFLFAPFAVKLRREIPHGFTLTQFIEHRFVGATGTQLVFLFVFFGYQLGAIVINALAGGTLLHALSGMNFSFAVLSISVIALSYSLFGGLRASVLTDVVQMAIVLLIGFAIVPMCLGTQHGVEFLIRGMGGANGDHADLFDPWVAFSVGIPMTLGLLAGPFCDQMFIQRALAVREHTLLKTFVLGGLLFGIVPILLSILGFIGAGMVRMGSLTVSDPQLVGPEVISALLPPWALWGFCLMAFAGLCSTMDSAFCAASALGSIDVYRRYLRPHASTEELLTVSRIVMLVIATVGTLLALLQPKLLWVFLIYGALASSAFFPTVLSLCWKRATAAGAFWGVSSSLILGTPLSFYANITEDPYLIVISALLSVGLGLLVCVGVSLRGSCLRHLEGSSVQELGYSAPTENTAVSSSSPSPILPPFT